MTEPNFPGRLPVSSTSRVSTSRLPSGTSCESNPTIACRLTPEISAAIATIAVRGPDAVGIVTKLFARRKKSSIDADGIECPNSNSRPRSHSASGTYSAASYSASGTYWAIDEMRFGQWNPGPSLQAAEQVVVCRVSLEQVEIHAHGGMAVCQMILDDLRSAGCEIVSVAQWPRDSIGTLESQAEQELEHAITAKVAAMLLDQTRGALSVAVRAIIRELQAGRFESAQTLLADLLHWGEIGVRICRKPRVCLAGPPNVGKSSLMNAILGIHRALVHHEPGTTRDAIDAVTAIDGWPINLMDTAGIRATDEPIEREGIAIAREELTKSDLLILVVDATVGWTQIHDHILAGHQGRSLVAWNKCDLTHTEPPMLDFPVVSTSAMHSAGVEPLLRAMSGALFHELPPPGQAVPFRQDQLEVLTMSHKLLLVAEHAQAIETLNQLL